jgi:hypothetical protein
VVVVVGGISVVDVVVVIGIPVVVVVVVGTPVVVVVVTTGSEPTGISIKLEHTPMEIALTIVVPSGTPADENPDNNWLLVMFISKGLVYPSTSEYNLKGPASAPITVKCIYSVIIQSYLYYLY